MILERKLYNIKYYPLVGWSNHSIGSSIGGVATTSPLSDTHKLLILLQEAVCEFL